MAADLYAVLGVSRTASTSEIKRAYRRIATECHPDKTGGDARMEARFKEASAAWAVLGDPEKRRQYDATGGTGGNPWEEILNAFASRMSAAQQDAVRGARSEPPRASTSSGPAGPGGFPFEHMFRFTTEAAPSGSGKAKTAPPPSTGAAGPQAPPPPGSTRRRGEDLSLESWVDFRTAAQGGRQRVVFRLANGRQDTVFVDVPPGTRDRTRVTLQARGQISRRGGRRGDLHITLRVQQHPWFRALGSDLELDLPLTPSEALTGVEVEIPSLDGRLTVRVPPGVSSGGRLRVRGRGLRRADGSLGDLVAVVQVALPKAVPEESLEILRRLEQQWGLDPRAGRWER